MTMKELFDFVIDPTITDENVDEYLDKAQQIASDRGLIEPTAEEQVSQEVFRQAYIPRTLDEVVDFEKDMAKAKDGQTEELFYRKVTGMNADLTGAQEVPDILQSNEPENKDESSSDEESESSDSECSGDEEEEETGEEELSKKEKKKLVKEANREKRKIKTPKHVKKRKEKLAKTKRGKGKN